MTRFLALPFFLVLLLPAAPVAQTFDGEPVQQRVVPYVVGAALEQARAAITQAGLRVGQINRVRSDTAAGIVIGQSPGARTSVAPNSAVNLTVSRGSTVDSTTVPDLTNATKLGIIPLLLLSRLEAGRTDSVLNEEMPGRVVRQSPAPGTRVPRGTKIDLWFGYATPRTVPNVVGSTPAEAAARLAQVDLLLGQVDTATTADGTGVITRQRPSANSRVNPGTRVRVNLTVPSLIAVPNLIDSTVTAARTILSQRQLMLVDVDTTRSVGARSLIAAQDPAPQTLVARGAPVRVTVAVPPPLVMVPNLIGATVAEAHESLARARLRLAETDSVTAAGGSGRIARQQPTPGSAADPGSGVSITVTMPLPQEPTPPPPPPPVVTVPEVADTSSEQAIDTAASPPPPITLPNLVGMPRARARAVLDSLGVSYRILEARRRTSVDTVVSQAPAAGTVITASMQATLIVGRSWLPLILIVLAAAGAVAAIVLGTRKPQRWRPGHANLRLVPHADPGTQTLESDGELIRDEVLWTSHTDGGAQVIDDDFALIEDEL